MNANHMVKIVWTLVKRVVQSQFPCKKVKTGYRSCEPSTCLVATKQITCLGSPWTQSFHATVDPHHAVYRTPLAPLPLKYCHGWMKLWDNALDHGLNGTRAGLAIPMLLSQTVFSDRRCPVDDCEHIIPEGTPILCALH